MNRCLDCIQIWYGCSLGISDDLIIFWDQSIEKNMAAAAIKKNDMVVVGVIFSHFFLILMDRAYGWGLLPSIDGYFLSIALKQTKAGPRSSGTSVVCIYIVQ